jgi:hypothetical protein
MTSAVLKNERVRVHKDDRFRLKNKLGNLPAGTLGTATSSSTGLGGMFSGETDDHVDIPKLFPHEVEIITGNEPAASDSHVGTDQVWVEFTEVGMSVLGEWLRQMWPSLPESERFSRLGQVNRGAATYWRFSFQRLFLDILKFAPFDGVTLEEYIVDGRVHFTDPTAE